MRLPKLLIQAVSILLASRTRADSLWKASTRTSQTRSMDTRGHHAPEPSAVIDMKETLSRFAIFKGPHMCPSDIECAEDIESSGGNESHRLNEGKWHPQSKWRRRVIKRTNEK